MTNPTLNSGNTKVLVLEDEKPTAEAITNVLNKYQYQVTSIARSYDQALNSVRKEIPDVAICDISIMGNKNGIEAARRINEMLPKPIPIIYLTAHYDEATMQEAFSTRPASYLIKSTSLFTQDRQIDSAIQVALMHRDSQAGTISRVLEEDIYIWIKGVYEKIKIQDILYLEADNMATKIVSNHRILEVGKPLGKFLNDDLTRPDIIRSHRSFAFNKTNINSVDASTGVIFIDKSKVSHEDPVKAVINL
ncbi:MAG: response regulator transcription factor, partial [Bacteroidota bacterium]